MQPLQLPRVLLLQTSHMLQKATDTGNGMVLIHDAAAAVISGDCLEEAMATSTVSTDPRVQLLISRHLLDVSKSQT